MGVSLGSTAQLLNDQLPSQPFQPCFPSISKEGAQVHQELDVSQGSATQPSNVQLPSYPCKYSPSTGMNEEPTSKDDAQEGQKEEEHCRIS
ncbi:UNVERIFIED_CONTAM: hypothetical protein RMT77_013149 [Armadillidium vulgare]